MVRFSVSLDRELLEGFDRMRARRGYQCRSEAIRDLIRDKLVETDSQDPMQEVVGSLTLLYHHDTRGLKDTLTELQHHRHGLVLSTLHLHLDHDHCLEILVLRGSSAGVRELADSLSSLKGVLHGRLTVTSTGRRLA